MEMNMAFRKLFQGERVELVPLTAEDRDLMANWSADSEYYRNLDDDPVRPMNAAHYEDWIGGATKQHAEYQGFAIVAKPEGTRIGFIALFDIKYPNASAMFAVGIGDPAYRGKGYGREALGLMLDYAFDELGMYRVGLRVMAYNTNAIKAYESIGFVREGSQRGASWREGQRYDIHFYGILRDEWIAKRG
jgi:RimJ/RimL family protein N-acetyltransferase